jgi:hypothetical protein
MHPKVSILKFPIATTTSKFSAELAWRIFLHFEFFWPQISPTPQVWYMYGWKAWSIHKTACLFFCISKIHVIKASKLKNNKKYRKSHFSFVESLFSWIFHVYNHLYNFAEEKVSSKA